MGSRPQAPRQPIPVSLRPAPGRRHLVITRLALRLPIQIFRRLLLQARLARPNSKSLHRLAPDRVPGRRMRLGTQKNSGRTALRLTRLFISRDLLAIKSHRPAIPPAQAATLPMRARKHSTMTPELSSMTLEHLTITPEHSTMTQTCRTMILASWVAFLAIRVVRVAFLAATWVTCRAKILACCPCRTLLRRRFSSPSASRSIQGLQKTVTTILTRGVNPEAQGTHPL